MPQSMGLQRVRDDLVTEQKMFTIASFTIAKIWKLPKYSTMDKEYMVHMYVCIYTYICICTYIHTYITYVCTPIGSNIQP